MSFTASHRLTKFTIRDSVLEISRNLLSEYAKEDWPLHFCHSGLFSFDQMQYISAVFPKSAVVHQYTSFLCHLISSVGDNSATDVRNCKRPRI